MSKTYIVIWDDRHADVAAYPFDDRARAIDEAKKAAHSAVTHAEDYIEKTFNEEMSGGLIFSATYSCEGDSISVVERELNDPIEGL